MSYKSKLLIILFTLSVLSGCKEAMQQLPLVIPHPQMMQRADNENIVLGDHGRVVVQIELTGRDGFLIEAGNLIESTLSNMGFSEKSDSPQTTIVITNKSEITERMPGVSQEALVLTPAEDSVLARSDQAYVIRMRPAEPSMIWIIGASPLGAYYGATTLVQLVETGPANRAVVGNIEVQDYPDIPYRMSADWLLNWDWEVHSYDWGDGVDAFIARSKRKIDMCSRYKVNMIRFLGGAILPGPDYMKDRYPMIKQFAMELNRYARRKGVTLQYSSMCWGEDWVGGYDVYQPWVLNREGYPDGKVYTCIGYEAGSCLSNDELTQIIAGRIRQFVEDTEPGSIYLHHIDIDSYTTMVRLWKKRCPHCRERYPDEEPFNSKGLAGAVANFRNLIVKELKSVKNPTSGYDAAHDLSIVFASPGYTLSTQSDTMWEKEVRFYQEIGRQLKDNENVYATFREQFKRVDNQGLRTEEMASSLAQVGWPHGVFMFAIQGGGYFPDHHMLVSSPVLTETYRGAEVLYNFNGHVHCEVQVLANVNYAWNYSAPGSVDPMQFEGQALEAEALRYERGSTTSDYMYGRFLTEACAKLYGRKAAPYMAEMFRLEREQGYILPVMSVLPVLTGKVGHWWKDPKYFDFLLQEERNGQARAEVENGLEFCSADAKGPYDFKAQAERNRQARVLVENALEVCSAEAKEDLNWLSRCLEVGVRICDFYDFVYQEKPRAEEVDANASELLIWLDENFEFQKAEPYGGDLGIWKSYVTGVSGFRQWDTLNVVFLPPE